MRANAEVSMRQAAVMSQCAQTVRDDCRPCSLLIRDGARRQGVPAADVIGVGVCRRSTNDLWKL